jgi:hypothetical protein
MHTASQPNFPACRVALSRLRDAHDFSRNAGELTMRE